jgi:hypothetical protein
MLLFEIREYSECYELYPVFNTSTKLSNLLTILLEVFHESSNRSIPSIAFKSIGLFNCKENDVYQWLIC